MGAQLRVVRRRIRSVQSTKKITRAMELIASSRIVKAQQRVEQSRPYAEQLTKAMEDLAANAASLQHDLLADRPEPRRVGVLALTSDRGLAGAYSANVLKEAEGVVREVRARGLEPVLYVVGKKGVGYFRFRGVAIEQGWQGFSEVPVYEKAEEIGRTLIDEFADERIDELWCAYTDFRSAFTQRATHKRFLPIAPEEVTGTGGATVEPGVPVRARARADPRSPVAAVPDHEDLGRAARVGRVGERGAPSRDEGGDRQRGRPVEDPDAPGEPGAAGRDHDRDHGDRRRRRGARLRPES